MAKTLEYGPVICTNGKYKGRIGYFDDEENECDLCREKCCVKNCKNPDIDCEDCEKSKEDIGKCPTYAVVYWGEAFHGAEHSLVSTKHISCRISMKAIVERIEKLENSPNTFDSSARLIELLFVQSLFYEKHIKTMYSSDEGKRIFISHSSKNKGFANSLYADLVDNGFIPWLDERDIYVGQSIPREIQQALNNSDYIVVVLTPASVESNWVSTEWEAVFWDDMKLKTNKVIPLLLEECEIPPFLKVKKYADFTEDYETGFHNLVNSISR
jgi:hypothetical protein